MKYIALSILLLFVACSNSESDQTFENSKNTDLSSEKVKDSNSLSSTDDSKIDASDKFCTLSNGVKVEEGWSGNDTGNNWCNKCRCMNGNLACTRMACINSNPDKTFAKHPSPDKTPKPTSTPTAISTSQAKPDSKHENENQLITSSFV